MVPAFPAARPARPNFSCGPCAKHPGWQLQNLQDAPFTSAPFKQAVIRQFAARAANVLTSCSAIVVSCYNAFSPLVSAT